MKFYDLISLTRKLRINAKEIALASDFKIYCIRQKNFQFYGLLLLTRKLRINAEEIAIAMILKLTVSAKKLGKYRRKKCGKL